MSNDPTPPVRAFVFPGQGSQKVGMGAEIVTAYPAARAVFDEVDEALGEALSKLIANGPEDTLTLTANAQPALMAVSIATLRALEAETGKPFAALAQCAAGHSLGEYSALVAAGVLSLADAARLLRLRGQAMQAAVPPGEGAMVAVLGMAPDAAQALAASAEEATGLVCAPANDNAPGQIVLSGAAAAVAWATENAKERGAKRAIPLSVSAPFHCSLMAPARAAMDDALGKVSLNDASVPVFTNVTADASQSAATLRDRLVAQVTAPVRWRETMTNMRAGRVGVACVDSIVEVGAGKVLCGLARQADRAFSVTALNTPDDIAAFAQALTAAG